MNKLLASSAIILAGLAVGIADAFIKKAAQTGSFPEAIKSPWMLGAVLLYILQIIFFVYVFMNQWKLGIVSNIQIVFFSLTAISIGYFFFGEKLSNTQIIGVVLAITGVILMNISEFPGSP